MKNLISFLMLITSYQLFALEQKTEWEKGSYTKTHKPDSKRAECYINSRKEKGIIGFHWDRQRGKYYDLSPKETVEHLNIIFVTDDLISNEGGFLYTEEGSDVYLSAYDNSTTLFKDVKSLGSIDKYGLDIQINKDLLSLINKSNSLSATFTIEGGRKKTTKVDVGNDAKNAISWLQSCIKSRNF